MNEERKKRKRMQKPNIMIERKKKETWRRGKMNREKANVIIEVKNYVNGKKNLIEEEIK